MDGHRGQNLQTMAHGIAKAAAGGNIFGKQTRQSPSQRQGHHQSDQQDQGGGNQDRTDAPGTAGILRRIQQESRKDAQFRRVQDH